MTQIEDAEALKLSDVILDKAFDPDADICILARQLLRKQEALETQAARVKELEAERSQLLDTLRKANDCTDKLLSTRTEQAARIATLEAQLEAFKVAAQQIEKMTRSVRDDGVYVVKFAFDALMSALRNTETKDG